MKKSAPQILLAFYGDDFTGTAATAEALTESGTPTLLFTAPPSAALLRRKFPGVRAVGVAGMARTVKTRNLSNVLLPIFKTMKAYGAPVFLYKVCSTFDSSPKMGSIGKAIELGQKTFGARAVPLLPAAPRLGRYTAFGHHFAALGQDAVYRLDRHPSMSCHPVTPMKESDLRMHLKGQTRLPSHSVDLFDLERGVQAAWESMDRSVRKGAPIVLFDSLHAQHIDTACAAIWTYAKQSGRVFMVGAQEAGYGFSRVWKETGLLRKTQASATRKPKRPRGPVLVLSGSCAVVTGRQIQWAKKNGLADVAILAHLLLDPGSRESEKNRITARLVSALQKGRSIVAHTAVGPQDARIQSMKKAARRMALPYEKANTQLGDALGDIAREAICRLGLKRLVVAGGDTSGRIQKKLNVRALQIAETIGIAAPLCYVYSEDERMHGLEVAFKGGQIGSEDYFGRAEEAKTLDFQAAALGRF